MNGVYDLVELNEAFFKDVKLVKTSKTSSCCIFPPRYVVRIRPHLYCFLGSIIIFQYRIFLGCAGEASKTSCGMYTTLLSWRITEKVPYGSRRLPVGY